MRAFLVLPILACVFGGCSSGVNLGSTLGPSSAIPNGTWVQTSDVCNGVPSASSNDLTLVVSGAGGAAVQNFSSSCVQSNTMAIAYTKPDGISVTLSNTTCNGSATASCNTDGVTCVGSGGARGYIGTYSVSGNTLTLTLTDSDCDGSAGNATEIATLTQE